MAHTEGTEESKERCPTNLKTLRQKATDSLVTGKAPGKDCIPVSVIKCGKLVLLPQQYELSTHCWTLGTGPQDRQDANIITLYKNKGDHNNWNNYQGISLLSAVGKLIAWVVLRRLQVLADCVYQITVQFWS